MVADIGRTPQRAQPPRAPLDPLEVSEQQPARPTTQADPAAQRQSYAVYLGPKLGVRTYEFPTHFRDVEMLTAQILLPTDAVRRWLEKSAPDLEPSSTLGKTRGIVTVQHMANPAGMDPYFEGSFAVRVRRRDGTEGWHVLEMPVTSEENKERGRRIFGYGKEMAQVSIADAGKQRVGSAATEDGRPLFTLGVRASRLGWTIDRKNRNMQRLNGRLVDLDSELRGRLAPGLGHVEFGEEMQRLYPGLPRTPIVLFGGRITGADLFLALPRGSDGKVIVPPSAEPRIL